MARFRYTKKELEEFSDIRMLIAVLEDRKSSCTNVYSPLYKRLNALQKKLEDRRPLTRNEPGDYN